MQTQPQKGLQDFLAKGGENKLDPKQRRAIVLVDDENRENEGDLVIPAEKVTPEAINFMVRNGCGILGLSMSAAICDRLGIEIAGSELIGMIPRAALQSSAGHDLHWQNFRDDLVLENRLGL